jgi:F-type H+-transporting ATPase subunit gamma
MANLKEVRNRITSVTSTQQITSAMKMVSAAKLRRAQDAVTQLRPYASKLKEILENLNSSLENSEAGAYGEERPVKKVLIVALSSNRGLCGAFNANVIKQVNRLINEDYKGAEVQILAIGKKVNETFKKGGIKLLNEKINQNTNELFDNLVFENVAPVAQFIMNEFLNKSFDKVELVYNQFKNAAVQVLTTEQFLPVKAVENDSEASKKSQIDYIYEPNQQEIIDELIPKSLKTQFYKTLLDSYASEHGARMTAMHKATDNAKAMLKELKLTYNKARQAAITNEILEIVGGAEALNN